MPLVLQFFFFLFYTDSRAVDNSAVQSSSCHRHHSKGTACEGTGRGTGMEQERDRLGGYSEMGGGQIWKVVGLPYPLGPFIGLFRESNFSDVQELKRSLYVNVNLTSKWRQERDGEN